MSRALAAILGGVVMAITANAVAQGLDVFSVAAGDVTDALVIFRRDAAAVRLKIQLTPEKSRESAAITARSVDKRIRVVVLGQEVCTPGVKEPITGSSFEFEVREPLDAVCLAWRLARKAEGDEAAPSKAPEVRR